MVSLAVAGSLAVAPTDILRRFDAIWQEASNVLGEGVRTGREVIPSNTTSPSPRGAVLIDRATRVRDGDTIVVGLIPIRIANLDCAERGTAAGERATRRAKELVAGKMLSCRLEGRRSHDREVGVCTLESGRDFGEVMIAEGYCFRWRR